MIACRKLPIALPMFAAGLVSGPALGADQDTMPRARTGPQAVPAPLPDYPQPVPPEVPVPLEPAPPAPVADTSTLTLGNVDVTTPNAGLAIARSDWRIADPATGLRLALQRGEAMDAAWVRRMFDVNGLIGAPTSFGRVAMLVQEINRAFLLNGYVNSGVLLAEQPDIVPGGTLQLQLVYGQVGTVAVQWGPHGSKGLRDQYIIGRMGAARNTPLNAIALERDFRRLASDPALSSINADLRPGSRPGEANVTYTVDPQPRYDLYFGAANSRSPSVGGERIFGGGSIRNFVGSGDVLSSEYGRTRGVNDAQIGYTSPFVGPRSFMSLRGSFNDAAVVDPQIRPLDIRSRDWAIEGGLSYRLIDRPLLPTPQAGRWVSARSLTVGVLAAHRKTLDRLLGQPFSFSAGSVDGRAEYSVLRITGDFLDRNVSQVFGVSFTGTIGLEGTRSDIPTVSSPRQQFLAGLVQLNYARRLNTQGLEIHARAVGQYTNTALYSAERLSVGGESSVRGFRENYLLSDTGLIGTIELAQSFSLSRGGGVASKFDWGSFSALAFVDGATIGNIDRAPPQIREVASVGASLAWTPSDAVTARGTFGQALAGSSSQGTRDIQDRGFQFRITIRPLAFFR